jgi:transposase
LILKLLAENRFPAIWLPTRELLDLRALLLHRHQWVRMRTRIQNALQAIALANGLRRRPHSLAEQARNRFGARLLMTHPGVGPVTALATDVFLGDPRRFADAKALASYVGIIPREYSRGGRQRLGGLSNKVIPCCAFSGARQVAMPCAAIRS